MSCPISSVSLITCSYTMTLSRRLGLTINCCPQPSQARIEELPLEGPFPLSPPLLSATFPSLFFPFPPLSFFFPPLPSPSLEVGEIVNVEGAYSALGSTVSSPSGVRKWIWYTKAVGKPLVAIILSILKCMFYSRSISSAGVLTPPSQSCIRYRII